ncbi:archaellin/type IV pilin N-terminal domain-containing protein [Haloterrigena salinisoli]|uniref:archaellin/type IV pilin N-terminal domain-containing protein n=1 Tax=Haloterrigena salinisoli TaxID=3132747 RepID=UPI0030CC1A7E
MFEAITDNEERGQVGIGTLIVFIAMVLVAAIAAGVLINTAGVLQSQASDTGSETQEEVANQIDVVHAIGEVGTSGDNQAVDRVNLTIKKSAGSNAIDLTSMTVQYTSDDKSKTLIHGGNNVTNANDTVYTTSGVDTYEDNSLTSSEQRVVLTIQVNDIEQGTEGAGDATGLPGGSDATIKLVDQSGAQYTYGVSVPSTFGDKNVVEV